MARITDSAKQNAIGERIKELRIRAGLSQQQLSGRLEVNAVYICRGSISRIESGERTVSDIEIIGLAKVLGVPIQSLFE